MQPRLTRRQQAVYDFLLANPTQFPQAPTLDELCEALGMRSRGSLHKHIQALIAAGLIAPMNRKQRGVHLCQTNATDLNAQGAKHSAKHNAMHSTEPGSNKEAVEHEDHLPWLGYIAAGQPIEAIENPQWMQVPTHLHQQKNAYVLKVQGDSMIEEGILDGDWVIIEKRNFARNGEIVVALINNQDATLKRIEQKPGATILHPANAQLSPMVYEPSQVKVQGILIGQMRSY